MKMQSVQILDAQGTLDRQWVSRDWTLRLLWTIAVLWTVRRCPE
jgi:hypothetical protein